MDEPMTIVEKRLIFRVPGGDDYWDGPYDTDTAEGDRVWQDLENQLNKIFDKLSRYVNKHYPGMEIIMDDIGD